jgi:hypothetical protein
VIFTLNSCENHWAGYKLEHFYDEKSADLKFTSQRGVKITQNGLKSEIFLIFA